MEILVMSNQLIASQWRFNSPACLLIKPVRARTLTREGLE